MKLDGPSGPMWPPNLWSSIPGLNSDSSCQASEQKPPCSRPLWISARRSRGQKSPRPGADRQGWRRLWQSCDTRWCSPNLTIGSSSLRLSWIAFNNHLWSWSHFCHFHVSWSQRSPWSGVQLKVFCAFGSLDPTGMVLEWMWSRKDKNVWTKMAKTVWSCKRGRPDKVQHWCCPPFREFHPTAPFTFLSWCWLESYAFCMFVCNDLFKLLSDMSWEQLVGKRL